MTDESFGQRLFSAFTLEKRLCVGIDPHPYLLESWGLDNTVFGLREFALSVCEAALPSAAAIKPQVAFFERFGAEGFSILEELISVARDAGMLVIADAKRGDVGSSFDAYADAWLKPGAPLEVDALTVNPFQGFGVLTHALSFTNTAGKGVFVLAATSNPEAKIIQDAQILSGGSVANHLLESIDTFNALHAPNARMGNVGAVLGATVLLEDYGIDVTTPAKRETSHGAIPVLAPGVGHQGGQLEQMKKSFGSFFHSVLVNESRSLVQHGPDALGARIASRASEIAEFFGRD